MAAKKGRPAKAGGKNVKTVEKQAMASRQVSAIILLAAAVLVLCMLLIKGQNVWSFMHDFFFGVFGIFAYLLPIIIGYISIMLALDKADKSMKTVTIVSFGLLEFLCATVDIFVNKIDDLSFFSYITKAYTQSMETVGGGFFGSIIGYPFTFLFGATGAKIIAVIIVLALALIITRTSIVSLYDKAARPVREMREKREIQKQIKPQDEEEYFVAQDLPEKPKKRRMKSPDDGIAANPRNNIEAYDTIPVMHHSKPKNTGGFFSSRKKQLVPKNSDGAKFNIDVPIDSAKPTDDGIDVGIDMTPEKEKLFSEYTGKQPQKIKSEENVDKADKQEIKPAKSPSKKPMADDIENLPATGITVDTLDGDYKFPPLSLLSYAKSDNKSAVDGELKQNSDTLLRTLKSFGVETKLIGVSRGPSVTRYELQPAAGVKISKITNLADDIALNLASAGVRIEAPIPNKAAVGIEVPNRNRSSVSVREMLESPKYRNAKSKLCCALGKDISGDIITMDIAKMPHLLVAGTTGSGKSVCLNSMIFSILFKAHPDEVKLIMIDPKSVEFIAYNGIPHLLIPVVTNPQKAAGALSWAVNEMLKRYQTFSAHSVRNIQGYNELCKTEEKLDFMPQIVIFIDELSDLMGAAPNEVEDAICRLAQMARAAGIHMVIATQSPRVDVITGLIKSNIPSRIALTVQNGMDSRVILDMSGAEKLVGKGDMLYSPVGLNKPLRVQGCYVPDEEVNKVVEYIKNNGEQAEYDSEIAAEIEKEAENAANKNSKGKDSGGEATGDNDYDERLSEAVELVCKEGQASTSLLQRKLKLGYARAARMVDQLEESGVVGAFEGSKPRKVLMTYNQWLERQSGGHIEESNTDFDTQESEDNSDVPFNE